MPISARTGSVLCVKYTTSGCAHNEREHFQSWQKADHNHQLRRMTATPHRELGRVRVVALSSLYVAVSLTYIVIVSFWVPLVFDTFLVGTAPPRQVAHHRR